MVIRIAVVVKTAAIFLAFKRNGSLFLRPSPSPLAKRCERQNFGKELCIDLLKRFEFPQGEGGFIKD